MLATFGAMLATGDAAQIGAVAFVPWIGLIGIELGLAAGAISGAAGTALYLVAAEMAAGPAGWRSDPARRPRRRRRGGGDRRPADRRRANVRTVP